MDLYQGRAVANAYQARVTLRCLIAPAEGLDAVPGTI